MHLQRIHVASCYTVPLHIASDFLATGNGGRNVVNVVMNADERTNQTGSGIFPLCKQKGRERQ